MAINTTSEDGNTTEGSLTLALGDNVGDGDVNDDAETQDVKFTFGATKENNLKLELPASKGGLFNVDMVHKIGDEEPTNVNVEVETNTDAASDVRSEGDSAEKTTVKYSANAGLQLCDASKKQKRDNV